MNKFFLIILCSLISFVAKAQDSEMATTMRSNGKIYVVVAVCLTVLLILLFFVIRLDIKLSHLEKKNN